jgi:HSP20 family protein
MTEKPETAGTEPNDARQGRPRDAVLRPPVNVFENPHGITLEADMPGVSKERLTVRVDKDTLHIEGDVHVGAPEGMDSLYTDVRATRFERDFALSGELDTEQVEASLRDGVLTVRIPKRAAVRPRKIEIRTG